MQRTFKAASAAVVLGKRYVRQMQPFLPKTRWRVVPNAVRLPRRIGRKPSKTPGFLFLGNLTRRKGAFDLVSATAMASARGFRGIVKLAGEERAAGQKAELLDHIRTCGCQSQVRLLGVVVAQAKARALAAADCLVLPSYAEGLPMAVLEAIAYGRPVIATKVGAISELITDAKEGFLIEPGDVEALADRMLTLSRDRDCLRKMGLAARRRAEQACSMDAMVEAIMGIYDELLRR